MSIPGSGSPLLLASSAAVEVDFAEVTHSLRFNSADSTFLNKTFSSAGNRKTFTFSCWVKRAKLGVRQFIFEAGSSDTATDRFMIRFQSDDTLMVTVGQATNRQTTQVFRDVGAWGSLIVAVDTTTSTADNRIKIYWNGSQITDFSSTSNPSLNANTGVNSAAAHSIGKTHIDNSHYLDAYLADVYLIDGTAHDASKFGAYDDNGVWQAIVPSGLTFGTNGFHLKFASTSTTAALGTDSSGNSHTFTTNNFSVGSPVYFIGNNSGLDSYIPSGWTNTSDPNNVLNNNNTGVLINQGGTLYFAITPTSSSISIKWIVYDGSGTYNPTVSLNTSSSWNGTTVHPSSTSGNGSSGNPSVGTYSVSSGTTYYVRTGLTGSGNPALVVYITNVTIAAVGSDYIPADFSKDSPTNDVTNTDSGAGGEVSGNYCTLNPLDQRSGTLSNGNLDYDLGSGTKFSSGTIAVKSGKWFWEAKAVSGVTSGSVGGRFAISQTPTETHGENGPFTLFWHAKRGIRTAINGTITVRATGTNYSDGDMLGLALDADANIAYFYKNGSLAYTYDFSSLVAAGSQFLAPSCWNGSNGSPVWSYNFGTRPFKYSARTNHKCLVSTNLPTPTIADGSDYFDVVTYTGNGTSYLNSQTVGGLSFSPDFLWVKCRSNTADHHLANTLKGINKNLESNNNGSNQTNNNNGYISATTSDGFTVVYGGIDGLQTNDNSKTYVAWAWDAASSTSSNTDGSITSQVRANQTAGFSVVAYTGSGSNATVGHGLNAALDFIIVKRSGSTGEWRCWHSALASNQGIDLNGYGIKFTDDSFNNTIPTNSVFSLKGGVANVNASSSSYVAYCFTSVSGYSSMGQYEANSSADGPFVHTGFRPRWVMVKNIDDTQYATAYNWTIVDTARYPVNIPAGDLNALYANSNVDENTYTYGGASTGLAFDIYSNGFKPRSASAEINTGNTYLYVAFAENPFQANGGLAR